MLYLLDANVLIDANRDYYSLERVPEFWEWLQHHGELGTVCVPVEIFDELQTKNDDLSDWLKSSGAREALRLDEEPDPAPVSRVVSSDYAPDLTDDEVEQLGRDPFLIAHALVDPDVRRVVTTETSKPSRVRANRHIPDVCMNLGVTCLSLSLLPGPGFPDGVERPVVPQLGRTRGAWRSTGRSKRSSRPTGRCACSRPSNRAGLVLGLAEMLFLEQVGMGACSLERDHSTLHPIDEQPVRLEVTLAMPLPLPSQRVVLVLLRQALPMD